MLALTGRANADDLWLVDGGAVPLFWIPVATQLSLDHWAKPRSSPLWFDANEGGATPAPWVVPDWTLYAAGLGTGVAMALDHDGARFYHVKGLAESMATSGLVMTVLKDVFGRHRPDWTAATTDRKTRQSFPSGHATEAFAIATYGVLYLHDHVFAGGGLTLGRGLAYGGVFVAASVVAGERVYHHRHHVSDVVVGALIGAATSVLTYRYQEQRAVNGSAGDLARARLPAASGRDTVFSFGAAF